MLVNLVWFVCGTLARENYIDITIITPPPHSLHGIISMVSGRERSKQKKGVLLHRIKHCHRLLEQEY